MNMKGGAKQYPKRRQRVVEPRVGELGLGRRRDGGVRDDLGIAAPDRRLRPAARDGEQRRCDDQCLHAPQSRQPRDGYPPIVAASPVESPLPAAYACR